MIITYQIIWGNISSWQADNIVANQQVSFN
uniref:Uncharacterized protein n=1 Tax=Rhizophora mucronata TaxID=61149 RepID=A0A2P2PN57_RHIMU